MAIKRRLLYAGREVNPTFYLSSQIIDGLLLCVSFYDLEKDLLTYGKYFPVIGSLPAGQRS
jgi:hypothetical protein